MGSTHLGHADHYPTAADPPCLWGRCSPQDGPCGDHMPLRTVLSSPEEKPTAHSTQHRCGRAGANPEQSWERGKGSTSFAWHSPKAEEAPAPLCILPSRPTCLQLPLSGGSVSGREGHGPVPSWLPLGSARAVPCPQEPHLVAVLTAIGLAAASEEQCAPTVWYQIVHQNYYFQHLWLNCKTIIQMTLGVCWS